MPDVTSRLTLANKHSQLVDMGAWLERIAASNALPAQATFQLDLVLTETVTNVMDHARPEPSGQIELACSIQGDRILVQVSDDGPPFDPTAHALARLPDNLEAAEPGGLGIHLMRQYTIHMEYRREGGRNILSLSLPLERQTSPA